MAMHPYRQFAAAIACGTAFLGGSASDGATFRWDPDPAAGIQGGTGSWEAVVTNTNWQDAANVQANWLNGNSARFTTGSGTVTVTGTVAVANSGGDGGLHFDDAIGSYLLQGGTISLQNTPTIRTAFFGDSITLSSSLSGNTGFKRTGTGSLIITADNSATLSGTITIEGQNPVSARHVSALGTGNIIVGNGTAFSTPPMLEIRLDNGGNFTRDIELKQGRITGYDSLAGGAGTIDLHGTLTVTGPASGNLVFTSNNNESNVRISGPITGTGGITFMGDFKPTQIYSGAGNLTYQGDTRNTTASHSTTLFAGTTLPATTRLLIEAGSFNLNGDTAAGVSHTVAGLSDNGTAGGTLTTTQAASININQATDLSFAGNITGAITLQKLGAGSLTLSHANNTYSGPTTISGGALIVNGKLTNSAVTVTSGKLGGSGTVKSISGGAGSVEPGNSPGVLTTETVAGASLDYAFQYTAAGDPSYSSATASVNDVLRLTGATPFGAPLGAGNRITVYLNDSVDGVGLGDVFRGGFFTDNSTDFAANITGADLVVYVRDIGGATTYGGLTYSPLAGPLAVELATVAAVADFGSGAVSGRVMQLTVVPEPAGAALLALAGGVLLRRCRPNT
jgi:fibronectin-binding autotransporter adhesin